jgi:molybdopterin/thiamine biosynthesis adenylyltransferase
LDVFGQEGQRRIGASKIAVLGLGGLGSQVCQQLAYLGAMHFVIVDQDDVEESNLNRLVGANESDVGRSKNLVTERMIKSIQRTSVIESIDHKVPHDEVDSAVSSADVIVGCFDNDYPRMLTTILASQHGIPYVDAASGVDIGEGRFEFGGRVAVAGTSPGCLHCMKLLSQDEIRRAKMDDRELLQEAKLYGVPVESLRATGPSVIGINGVVASLAVVETMFILSGVGTLRKLITYRGTPGWVSFRDPELDDCYYCSTWSDRWSRSNYQSD